MKNRQGALVFIFVTLLLDIVGLGIIIPILPGLVTQFAGGNVSEGSQYFGWLIALYAAMQFLFSPVLGALSDRFGRRPVILTALFGQGLSLIGIALAPNLAWLFITRIVAGITGASIIPAQAYIADVTPPEKRAQSFGLVGAAFGLGFIIGPALGGVLGTFGPRIPFYAAAALTLVNFLYGLFVLPESLNPELRRPFAWTRANPIGSIFALTRHPVVLSLTGVYVAMSLAQQMLQSTWVLYATYRFNWGALENGLSLALVGIVAAVVQGGLLRVLIPQLGEKRALLLGLAMTALSYTLYGLATQSWMMYAIIPLGGLSFIATPAAQGLISRQYGPSEQGTVQGALASLMSLTAIFGPLVATFMLARFTAPQAPVIIPGVAFFLGAALALLAALLAVRSFSGVSENDAARVMTSVGK